MLLMASLTGCGSGGVLDPVAWWHGAEGGAIAEARPPPPNVDAPYPKLSSIPDRPVRNDTAQRNQIANALVADRANAQYDATLAPLPASPPPANAAPAAVAPPTNDANTSSASLETASAPPPPPQHAPVASVQAAPLAPPAAQGTSAPAPAQAAGPADMPAVPDSPPAPPALPGVPQVTAATPPVPTPPPARAVPPAPKAGAPQAVGFAPGSSLLPSEVLPGLKALAASRGKGTIAVTGFGESAGSEPSQQAAAMPLALARARAIVAYLEQNGVPARAIRMDAEAAGTGGAARLIN